jgi:hypothetical protein
MVVTAAMLVTNPMGISNEDHLDAFVLQEVDDLMRCLVPPVAYLPLGACPQPGFGVLQFAEASRAFLATRLLAL